MKVLRRKFTSLKSDLNERGRRRWAASEALELGHGGLKAVAQATGLGERTIRRGCDELRHHHAPERPDDRRIRRAGGGGNPLPTQYPAPVSPFGGLGGPTTPGGPVLPFGYDRKAYRRIAHAL